MPEYRSSVVINFIIRAIIGFTLIFFINQFLSARFFHPAEHPLFSHLEDTQKKEMFFRYWTIREAFLKIGGEIIKERFAVCPGLKGK